MSNESSTYSVDRTAFSIASLDDDSGEVEYWLSRTPQERLHHIQRLRYINYGEQASGRLQRLRYINYGEQASGRLQRVLEVVELTSS